mmetsp:Transcript_6195/g.9326  ORF Transcript_6195/g.9326 Transcript_6195/m.9326 type:complete len:212 (-) Transcript_6195:39-674(-)
MQISQVVYIELGKQVPAFLDGGNIDRGRLTIHTIHRQPSHHEFVEKARHTVHLVLVQQPKLVGFLVPPWLWFDANVGVTCQSQLFGRRDSPKRSYARPRIWMTAQIVIVGEQGVRNCIQEDRGDKVGSFYRKHETAEQEHGIYRKPNGNTFFAEEVQLGPAPPKPYTENDIPQVAILSPVTNQLVKIEFDGLCRDFRHVDGSACDIPQYPP